MTPEQWEQLKPGDRVRFAGGTGEFSDPERIYTLDNKSGGYWNVRTQGTLFFDYAMMRAGDYSAWELCE